MKKLAILSTLLIGSYCMAGVFMIDDFSDPSSGNAHTSRGQEAWCDTNVTGVLGGYRDGSVGCESGGDEGRTTAQITGGEFEVTTNSSGSPSIYLGYDQTEGWGSNLDTDPFGDGAFATSQDFTDNSENDRFAIEFTYATGRDTQIPYFNDFLLTIKVDDTLYSCNLGDQGNDKANTWMEANYNTLLAGTAATFYVNFSEFSGSPDMSAIDAFALHICSENYDFEYSLGSISTIPEPATIGLIIGGGTLLLLKRKKSNSKF